MIPLTRRDWVSYIADRMLPFIVPGERVLDFGAGDGKMAEYVVRTCNARAELLDVKNHNQTALAHHLYDGQHIPFPAGSFDSAFAVAVLHHIAKDVQVRLLGQLKAICRRGVLSLWKIRLQIPWNGSLIVSAIRS